MTTRSQGRPAVGLAALESARAELHRRAAALVGKDGLDQHQVAANELAWAAAYAEAARATVEWSDESGNDLARDVATAAVREATRAIRGSGALQEIEGAALLESIAQQAEPWERIGTNEEQRLLRTTFRDFAEANVVPVAAEIHRQNLDIPEALISSLGQFGTFGLTVPEAYGGLQGEPINFEAMLIVTEELSRASLAVGSLSTRPEILVRALIRGGSEAQKQRWLPPIARGDVLVAVATTEPDYGSDVARVACRATRVPGGWKVTGQKQWCTFAGRAELLMLLLRTSDNGHRGLSVFIGEKPPFTGNAFSHAQPGGGSIAGRAIPTIGYRGMHTFELAFDRFFIPADSLIGGEEWLDRGFYLQMEGFSTGRLQTAARAVGVMQAALDDTVRYTSERRVFGRPIAGYGLPRAMLGRMIVRTVTARQLNRYAARLVARGVGNMEASLAKLYASRMAEYVTRDAMQLHGGLGYAEETAVSRYFLDAAVLSIFEGAEEVLALRVIAKNLLEGAR
jgi:(2S)-methylsuccinyl-CoA dehydrogenase